MATLSEHFVEESLRLSAYRGTAEDNGGVEPQYPDPAQVNELFQWTSQNLEAIRSLLPSDRDAKYGDWGIGTVITFADGTHATIYSAWMEDQIDIFEGTEDRDFHAQPGERIRGIATLHPAGQSGVAYFDRMAELQHGPDTKFGPDFRPAIAWKDEAELDGQF